MAQTYAVTGVASGIGAEIARVLQTRGHRVIGFDIQEVSANVDVFHPLDLNDPTSIATAAQALDEDIHALCNNAGLPPRVGLEEAILRVNFLGTRAFTHALLGRIQQGGNVLNMASRAGHGWRDNIAQNKRLAAMPLDGDLAQFLTSETITATRAYNLSKEAIILWTYAQSEPFIKQGLRINSISPGGIATGILKDFEKAFGAAMARNVERAGRPGTPAEVAEVACFMLSPEAHWLKGVDVPVDGGMGSFNLSDGLGLSDMLG